MPTPPAESIGGRLVSQLKESVTNKKKCFDFMIATVIFILAILEFISWRLSFGEQAKIADYGNNYLVFWYPFMSSLCMWVVSCFFLLKVIRYKACAYTEIITLVYFGIQTFNMSAFIFQFGINFYNKYIYPVFLFTIVALILIKMIKWLSQKQQ